jgi:AhpD family alkylhydroperoxidase
LGNAVRRSDLPETTLYLVELRASRINGCSVCVDMHSHELELVGEPGERIHAAARREAPYFTDAERAALGLTEAATRLADRSDPVPDEVWDEAARHYDEAQLAALVVAIATINAFNRINAAAGRSRATGPASSSSKPSRRPRNRTPPRSPRGISASRAAGSGA